MNLRAGHWAGWTLTALLVFFCVGSAKGITIDREDTKKPRFEDFYECYIIIDVEVSPYQDDEFEQVDCEDFMSIVARAKRCYFSFVTAFEVNLYDDEEVRYKLYFSKNCRYFRIDGNYFRLTKKQARQMKRLFSI